MLAVAEAARNVACAGGKPLAATNCLNFGNPERPAIMWQLAQAVEGIGDACRALGTPITGGNVSLYNETDGRAIYPTPVIGIVGVLEHADRVVTRRFQAAGDVIVLLGEGRGELGGSEYLKIVHGVVRGVPPALDLDAERTLQALLVELAAERLMRSAHDCSDGGLAVTLAECCFDTDGIGADVSIDRLAVARTGVGQPGGGALRRVCVARGRLGGAGGRVRCGSQGVSGWGSIADHRTDRRPLAADRRRRRRRRRRHGGRRRACLVGRGCSDTSQNE